MHVGPHPLVDYVVLAEFDIDTGSTVRHQFPSPIPGYSEDYFANNMLPEGAHNRDSDHTYLLLNRNSRQLGGQSCQVTKDIAPDDKWLLYGLVLVKRQRDEAARRGAVVKAICVFSRHHFVDALRQPIAMALDAYFAHPSAAVLARLFSALNAVDLAALPQPSRLEQSLRRRSCGVAAQFLSRGAVEHRPEGWTCALQLEGLRFDDIEAAEAVPAAATAAEAKEVAKEATETAEPTKMAETADNVAAAAGAVVTTETAEVAGAVEAAETVAAAAAAAAAAVVTADIAKTAETVDRAASIRAAPFLILTIPLSRGPDEVGEVSVSRLVRAVGEGVMRIFNAVLRRQRVLFVGYNLPAAEVAQMVHAAVGLVSPAIPGVIRRAFAYANLTDLSFLAIEGYIAGVTNPMFEQHRAWWDVLCVLDRHGGGAVVSSAEGGEGGAWDGSSSSGSGGGGGGGDGSGGSSALGSSGLGHTYLDARFYSALTSGLAAGCGEAWARQRFQDLTASIVNQALDAPPLLLGARSLSDKARRALEANAGRVAALKRTPEVTAMPRHPWELTQTPCEGAELRTHLRRLQCEGASIPLPEVEAMFADLLRVLQTEPDAQALLALLPESDGGLCPVAAGLFCASPAVKLSALQILDAVRSHPSTRPAVDCLNVVFGRAAERLAAKMQDGSLLRDIEAHRLQAQRREEAKVAPPSPPRFTAVSVFENRI